MEMSTTDTPRNSTNSTIHGGLEEKIIIAGCAGGGTIILLLILAACILACRGRRNTSPKAKEKPKRSKVYDLDSVVTTDTNKANTLIDEDAVNKIHSKSNFNLKRLIGKALARQVENVLLDSSRLTMGEPLGEGNFGVVYKSFLKNTEGGGGAVVAVKAISGDSITGKEMSGFIEEVLRMRHFSHRHVLNMLGLVIERNMPMVVMPFMSNGDLRAYVANPKLELKARDLVDYGHQVAEGMIYLSDQGFVHRDLAARNCLVDENVIVKVADFGLSRDIFNANYYKADNDTPLPVRWMAVESLKNNKFSVKSDVWSFGVLLWELFTRGSRPYPGIDNATVVTYVKKGGRMKQPPTTPDDLYALMCECWNENPLKRPTFNELSNTLRRLVTGSTTQNEYKNI